MSVGFLSSPATETFCPAGMEGLPLFRRDYGEYTAFYAPGCLCVVGMPEAEQFAATVALPARQGEGPGQSMGWGIKLRRQAELAVAKAKALREEPFRPECLTLYLNKECNLRCGYCYADPSLEPAARLSLATIVDAAGSVAANCRKKDRPFYVVFHGGGEPTLHRDRVESTLGVLDRVAAEHQVESFRYIATNGVMPEERVAWLARSFDLIGLSCDGPAEIHDSQRPNHNGRGTLHAVERTARVLHQEGARFHVRATITRASLERQTEIAEYICQQLSPEEIHFEPVYPGGRSDADRGPGSHRADAFVVHFLKARAVAQGYGISLSSSGSRPASIHGPYCNVFRQVLNLVPGDVATACFKAADGPQASENGVVVGAVNRNTGRFELAQGRIAALRQRLDAVPSECTRCFNRYHCTRGCPDLCPLDGVDQWETREAGFRCQVQRSLMAATLAEHAERLWSEVLAGKAKGPHGTAIL
jgi:sulfatase maturation enzyme AslB (radical SAM superfamily)